MEEDKIIIIRKEKSFPIKKVKIKKDRKENNNYNKLFSTKIIFIFSLSFLSILIIIQFFIIYNLKMNQNKKSYAKENAINNTKYDINFSYEDYDTEIITDKIKKDSKWILSLDEAKFINGLIRKNRLKKCLEIGVARGGSSILILNAIKDLDDSILVSLDLNKELFNSPHKLTGYRVNKYFPELTKKWKLLTGEQPHKFLVDLNIKFDFLFLDTVHVSPGKILNFIEALPFLNENAIIVLHDLLWHFKIIPNSKLYPSCISLIPSLYGDIIFLNRKEKGISNMGAVFLYPNQEKHYLNYFLLLLNF